MAKGSPFLRAKRRPPTGYPKKTAQCCWPPWRFAATRWSLAIKRTLAQATGRPLAASHSIRPRCWPWLSCRRLERPSDRDCSPRRLLPRQRHRPLGHEDSGLGGCRPRCALAGAERSLQGVRDAERESVQAVVKAQQERAQAVANSALAAKRNAEAGGRLYAGKPVTFPAPDFYDKPAAAYGVITGVGNGVAGVRITGGTTMASKG